MTLPCEQCEAVGMSRFERDRWHRAELHAERAAIRAEQAEALAAKDRELAALRAHHRLCQCTEDGLDDCTFRATSAEYEAQVSTLTARVQALETAVQALATRWEQVTKVALLLETDNPSEQGAAWHRGFGEASSRAAADLRALLTQEPT